MYPKTLFKDKQARELVRLEKEKAEVIEKYSKRGSFSGVPPKHPKTFREQVMLEIWQKHFAPKEEQKEISCVTSNMLD
jgi:hypothetical protein